MKSALLLAAALGTASLTLAQTPTPQVAGVRLGTDHPGIDPSSIDHAVKPGDDFYLFANGAWIARTPMPADRVSVNTFSVLADRASKQVQSIIDDLSKSSPAPNTDAARIANLYHAYMDESALAQHGRTAIQPQLDAIASIHDQRTLAHALGLTLRADTDALNNTNFHTSNLFGLWVAPGFNDPSQYAPYLMQGGLLLPDRAYYVDDNAKMKSIREAYATHAAKMFTLAGLSDPEARAARVIALENAIAKIHLSLEEDEDIHKANNVWPAADFNAKAPGLDWPAFFAAAGLSSQKSFYVWQPTAITGEAALVSAQSLQTWKDFLTLHLLETYATGISQPIADERFAFFGTTLTGAAQMRPRNERAIATVNGWLGEAVGRIYAQRYFSPEAKAQAEALVANLVSAFHQRLESITWMDPTTKAEALRKLGTLRVSVGYPDKWRSYDGLDLRPDDLLGDLFNASLFDYHYNLSRIGQPTDRKEWCMNPQTVNAVNLPLDNALNFPAAILQPPFFDPKAPAAANYGAIGSIMGHEISHTFDTEGADFDSEGRVRNWWTPADFAHFNAATSALAAQFDAYEPIPGLHVKGRQTLGEDIADLGGINAAYDAFHAALHGSEATPIAGFNGDQQFFLAFGQNWKTVTREAALRQQILTDPHAPDQDRALAVRNLDAWYAAFHIQPTDKLYLAPGKRIHIW